MTRCARCGAELAPEARFCGQCGAAVAHGGLAAPVRKHVVVLFVDIVGSTSLGESTDPEVLRAGLAAYFDTVSQVIWANGGTVEKFIGDAVMAVFGVPTTHEDDATRALTAAIGIQEAVAGLGDSLGKPLHVRIGVNSGEVFVTHQPDGQFSVTGDAVNTAQRLEAAAGPDEIYVGDTAAELDAGQTVLEPVGDILHKGKTVPQRVFRVASDQGAVPDFVEPTFVGRVDELEEIEGVVRAAWGRRQNSSVTWVGEPGIGKSRLIKEFAARNPDVTVLRGVCDQMVTGTYAQLSRMLEPVLERWDTDIAPRLGADASSVRARLQTLGGGAGRTSTEDIMRAVGRVAAVLTETAPLLFVIDDVQWGTDGQLDLVDALRETTKALPVITVSLCRPELFDLVPGWGGGRRSRVLEMVPLSEADLSSLVSERLGSQAASVDIAQVVNRSDGNPLVALMLAAQAGAGQELPATVAQLYEAALDRLSPAQRALCEGGAIFGRDWIPAGAASVLDGFEADPVRVADELRALNVLRLDEHGSYRFAQSVLMQTAYRSMPKALRGQRHLRAADWVQAHRDWCGPDTTASVATHLERAVALLAEVNTPEDQLDPIRSRAADAMLAWSRELGDRGDPARRSVAEHVLALGIRDGRLIDVAWLSFIGVDRGSSDYEVISNIVRSVGEGLGDDLQWRLVGDVPIKLHDRAAARDPGRDEGDLADVERSLRELGQLADPRPSTCYLVWLWAGQVFADTGRYGQLLPLIDEMIAYAQRNRHVLEEQMFRTFGLQLSFFSFNPLQECIELARATEAGAAGIASERAMAAAVLSASLSAAGDRSGADDAWARVEAALAESDPRPSWSFVWQYRLLGLQMLGDLPGADAAVGYCLDLVRGSETGIATGILAQMRCRVRALAGDREGFLTWYAASVADPRTPPQHRRASDALAAAVHGAADQARDLIAEVKAQAILATDFYDSTNLALTEAIAERLLGDEVASQAAAERWKESCHRKGAHPAADLIDEWLVAADNLRA